MLDIDIMLTIIFLILFLAFGVFFRPRIAFQKRKSKYPVLYEAIAEFWLIVGIAILTCVVFYVFEIPTEHHILHLPISQTRHLIVSTGNLLMVSMEIWIRLFDFWGFFRKHISQKGVSYQGKIIQYDVSIYQGGRGFEWREYIPAIQLQNGEIIKSDTTYLNPFPPVKSECIVTFYKERYIITGIIPAG